MSIRKYLTGGLPCFGGQSKQPKTKRNGAKSDAPLPIAAHPAKSPAATKMNESIGEMEFSNKKSASSASSSTDVVMENAQLSPDLKAKSRMNRARAKEQRQRMTFREFLLQFFCCCCLGPKTRNVPRRTRLAKKKEKSCEESAPVEHFDDPLMKIETQSLKSVDNTPNMTLLNLKIEIDSIKDPPLESFVEDHLKTLNDFELLRGSDDDSKTKQIPFIDLTSLTRQPFNGEEKFLSSIENIEKTSKEKGDEEIVEILSRELLQLSAEDSGLKVPDIKTYGDNAPNQESDFYNGPEKYFYYEDIPFITYETLLASEAEKVAEIVRACNCNTFDFSGESSEDKIHTPEMLTPRDDGQKKAEQEVSEPPKENAKPATDENTKQRAQRIGAFYGSIQPFYFGPFIDPRVAADMETSVRHNYNLFGTENDDEIYELCLKHLKEFGLDSDGGDSSNKIFEYIDEEEMGNVNDDGPSSTDFDGNYEDFDLF